MNLYKRFTRDAGIIALTELSNKIKGIVLIPIIAKTLGASPYGIYSVLIVTVSLLRPFSTLNLNQALMRFIPGEKDRGKISRGIYSSLSLAGITGSVISIIFYLSAETIAATAFGDINAVPVIEIGALFLLISSANAINQTFLLASGNVVRYAQLQIFKELVPAVIAVCLVLNGFGLEEIIYGFILVELTVFLSSLMLIYRKVGFTFPDIPSIRPWIRYSLPLIPQRMSQWITASSDRYLIALILQSSVSVGIYAVGYGIGWLVNMFLAPIGTILLPALSKLWEEKKMRELENHFRYSLKYFLALGIPAVFGLTVLSEPILLIAAGKSFVADAVVVIPLVATGALFFSIYAVNGRIFELKKKTGYTAVLWISMAALQITLNILLIGEWGIAAAAFSTLVCFFIPALISSIVLYKELKIGLDWLFIIKSFLASVIMSLIVWNISFNTFPEIIIPILGGAVIYFVTLILLRGFEEKEIKFFKEVYRAGRSKYLRI